MDSKQQIKLIKIYPSWYKKLNLEKFGNYLKVGILKSFK